jgi:hypothetical protein
LSSSAIDRLSMRHSPLCPSQPRPPAIIFCTLISHPPFTKSPIQKSEFYSLVIWVSTLLLQEIPMSSGLRTYVS